MTSLLFQAVQLLGWHLRLEVYHCFHNRLAYSRSSQRQNNTVCVPFIRLLSFCMVLRFIHDIILINTLFFFQMYSFVHFPSILIDGHMGCSQSVARMKCLL